MPCRGAVFGRVREVVKELCAKLKELLKDLRKYISSRFGGF